MSFAHLCHLPWYSSFNIYLLIFISWYLSLDIYLLIFFSWYLSLNIYLLIFNSWYLCLDLNMIKRKLYSKSNLTGTLHFNHGRACERVNIYKCGNHHDPTSSQFMISTSALGQIVYRIHYLKLNVFRVAIFLSVLFT